MEGNSAHTTVAKNAFFTIFKREILDSPIKSTGFYIVIAIILSFFIFGFFMLKQNLAVGNQAEQNQANVKKQAELSQERQQQATNKNLVAQDQTRKQDLEYLKSRLETFYRSKGYYPSSLFNLVPEYIGSVPHDPETGQEYYFLCNLDQKGYILRTTLSNGKEFELSN